MSGYSVITKMPIRQFIQSREERIEESPLDVEAVHGHIFDTLSDISLQREISLLVLSRPKFYAFWEHTEFYTNWIKHDRSCYAYEKKLLSNKTDWEKRLKRYMKLEPEYKNRIIRQGGFASNIQAGLSYNSVAVSDAMLSKYPVARTDQYLNTLRKELDVFKKRWELEEPEISMIDEIHTYPFVCAFVAEPYDYFQYQIQAYEEVFKGCNVFFLVFIDELYDETFDMAVPEYVEQLGRTQKAMFKE